MLPQEQAPSLKDPSRSAFSGRECNVSMIGIKNEPPIRLDRGFKFLEQWNDTELTTQRPINYRPAVHELPVGASPKRTPTPYGVGIGFLLNGTIPSKERQ